MPLLNKKLKERNMYILYYYYKCVDKNYIKYNANTFQELLYQIRFYIYYFGEHNYRVYKKIDNKYKRMKI